MVEAEKGFPKVACRLFLMELACDQQVTRNLMKSLDDR